VTEEEGKGALLDAKTHEALKSLEEFSPSGTGLQFGDAPGGWTLVDYNTSTLFEGFVQRE